MYERLPTLQEMEAAGFAPEDYETDPVEVYPENWPALDVFISMGTQWRVGMSGATGLEYLVLFRLLDRRFRDAEEWQNAFDDIRVMESAALDQMRKETST